MAHEHPVMDSTREQPIAWVLRPALRAVVEAFCEGDYAISAGIPMVEPVRANTARQIEEYIEDYGEALISLPEEAWSTSVSRWMDDYWDLLVALWTEESGRCDMRLAARVRSDGVGYSIEILSVHVP